MTQPYYDSGGITIYNARCEDVLPALADKSADLVLTDPPYESEAHTQARRVLTGPRPGHAVKTWRDARRLERIAVLPFAAIGEETRTYAAREIARIARRWALVFTQAEAAHKWEAALIDGGLTRRRWCIWVKPDGQPQFSGDRPGMGYETIVTTHVAGRSRWNGGGRVGVFTHVKNVTGSRQPDPHPTTKPIALIKELVALFSDPGDLVVDCFGGGGTTARACKDLGRRCILIEQEEKYCEVAAQRLQQEAFLWDSA